MKKLLVLISIAVLCFSFAFAHNDFMKKSGQEPVPVTNNNLKNIMHESSSKANYALPDWEWTTQPYSIMTSWYDYMPSSYESYPLRLQQNGDGGLYYTWHALPDDGATTNRRQYWAYINADDGSLVDWGTISTQDIWQGYGSIETHPTFGGGVATWHQQDATLGYGTTFTYDSYIFGTPGFWASYMFIPPDSPGGNEYIWPYIWVGPAPSPDSFRVYQTAKNYLNNSAAHPCEDARIKFCDVAAGASPDMSVLMNLDNWSELTPMYYWREKDCRPQSQCFTIDPNTPGHVAMVGYASWLSGDLGDMPVNPGVWVWESFDYGATWDQANLHSSPTTDEWFYKVDNIPQFGSEPLPDELEVAAGGWHNSARYDIEGNLHWNYLQQFGYTDAAGDGFYFPNFMPAAEAIWDGSTFSYNEVPEMVGVDPLSGHTVPWEIEGGDTLTYPVVAWSTYEDELFHENTMKNAVNLDNNWMVQLWADGTYITLNALGEPGYEDYATHPILYLSASANNGDNWSEPIELTDIYSAEVDFMSQITVYPYLCNKIEDMGGGWGKVHFSYMDDNSFGSTIQGAGQNTGGQLMYGSIKIDFGGMTIGVDDQPEVDVSSINVSNTPNPFNGSTTISFNAPKTIHNAKVKIYNSKGQLVKTLIPGANNAVEWNGKDTNNNNVANGIYFYKLETEFGTVSNKMLLSR